MTPLAYVQQVCGCVRYAMVMGKRGKGREKRKMLRRNKGREKLERASGKTGLADRTVALKGWVDFLSPEVTLRGLKRTC